MRISIVFVTGLLLGSFLAPGFAQETRLAGMNNINHVGISVRDIDAARAFYSQKMGFREAFVYRGANG